MRELTDADVMEAELCRLGNVDAPEPPHSLLVFRVQDTWLAVETARVDAVIDDNGCSRVVGTPPHILGVVSYRDRVVAILDVGIFCALPPRMTPGGFPRTLIVSDGPWQVGVKTEVTAGLAERVVKPVSTLAGAGLLSFLRGECETPWGTVGVLDVARLLEAARVRA